MTHGARGIYVPPQAPPGCAAKTRRSQEKCCCGFPSGGAQRESMTEEKTLLIVEDDRPLRERLARAMEARGFTVAIAESVAEGKARAKEAPPAYAVVDLKLEDGNGLDVVETLHTIRPESRVVVLTGFGNIATAVAAVKNGALDFFPQTAAADDIPAGLLGTPGGKPQPPGKPLSGGRGG